MELKDMKEWKVIPEMERYIINKVGEVRNRFTKKVIYPRKDKDLIALTNDKNQRVTRSPSKIARQLFGVKQTA